MTTGQVLFLNQSKPSNHWIRKDDWRLSNIQADRLESRLWDRPFVTAVARIFQRLRDRPFVSVQELNARIPGGAGADLNSLVNGWVQAYQTGGYNATNPLPTDFEAMNSGQLKWIANKVHARLVFAKYEDAVPAWLVQNPATDTQLVNLGQLKTVFYFDLTAPTGQLPEWWQKFYFNGQTGIDPNGDADGDGSTHLQEFQNGTNPQVPNIPVPNIPVDSDSDGLPDAEDADPNDSVVDWAPAAEATYAVIEMEQVNFAGYPFPAQLNPLNYWTHTRASIGKGGTVLWQYPVKSTNAAEDEWNDRYRVWKNGAWSADITNQSTEFTSFSMSTLYPSTIDTWNPSITTQVNVTVDCVASIPHAVCGDLILGLGDYGGSQGRLPVCYTDSDANPPTAETRNDGYASTGAVHVATLWTLGAESITAYPIDPPSRYKFMSLYYFGSSAPLMGIMNYRPVASPGGALAILGTQTTAGVGLWKIWDAPDNVGSQVPGQGSSTVINAGAWPHDDLLLIRAIEDGGVAVGERYSVEVSGGLRHQVVNDHGSESVLPGSEGLTHSALAICRVPTGVSGQSRLVAAGTDLWVQKNGQWSTAAYKPSANTIIAVSKNGVLLGTQAIWRNGKEISLDSLVANQKVSGPYSSARYTNLLGYAMNGEGAIVALADDALHPGSGKKTLLTLLPVDLISDLNNDGQITAADNPLRDAAMASGATDEIKDKGTEYILQDDVMSNGAWDNQDQNGNICFDWPQYGNLDRAPASGEMDDDAIAIEVKAPSFGVAWFTHEAIGSLSFFREKECLNAIAINLEQPFDLSTQLPERLWIKFRPTVSIVGTVKGKLTFHIGKSTSEEWGKIDLPLTLVPDFGCEKFFEAARNYMFERNTKVFIWDYKMPDRLNPLQIFRLCVMREEATTAKGYDAYANNKKGIGAVALAAGVNQPTVMVNGNQCFFRAGYDEIIEPDLAWDLAHMLNQIADGCHGRIIIAGATTGISLDNFDNTTKPARGSDLAGPDPIPVGTIAGNDGILGTADDILNPMAGNPGGKFFSLSGTTWNFAAGQATGTDAVGGLSSNYASSVRSDLPHQMVGRAPCGEQGKGCVFTATQIYGVGQALAFAAAAKKSGNQMLNASTDVLAQQLFILDSGDGSLALEHIDPVGNIRKAYIGRKSAIGFPYYVNNYVQFWATKPRP